MAMLLNALMCWVELPTVFKSSNSLKYVNKLLKNIAQSPASTGLLSIIWVSLNLMCFNI